MAYFVQKQVILICSNPTYLRCIAYQTQSKYDQPMLYRQQPRCISTQHTTCGERDHPWPFFNRLKNWSRSPTNPRCILDQHRLSPIKARSLPIRQFFQCGRERQLIGSLVWTGLYSYQVQKILLLIASFKLASKLTCLWIIRLDIQRISGASKIKVWQTDW